jgi:hypothetical protein
VKEDKRRDIAERAGNREAAPTAPKRKRFLSRCVASPDHDHTEIDISGHMTTVHKDWTAKQRQQALESCQYVTAKGTSYGEAEPLEEYITNIFHEYCLLVKK